MGRPAHCRGFWDHGIVSEVWDTDVYGLRALAGTGFRPRRFLDIGAHIGAFVLLAKELWPEVQVVAVEADPENVRLIEENTAGLPGIEILNAACAGQAGTACFASVADKGADNSGGGALVLPTTPSTERFRVIEVRAVTLAEVLAGKDCDVCKMDCEGAEASILEAARDAGVLDQVRMVRGEWHGVPALERVKAVLEKSHALFAWHANAPEIGMFASERDPRA